MPYDGPVNGRLRTTRQQAGPEQTISRSGETTGRRGIRHGPASFTPMKRLYGRHQGGLNRFGLVHLKASQPHSISGGLVPRSRCNGIYDRRFDEHKTHRLAALRTDRRRGFLGIGRSRWIRREHDRTLRHRILPRTGRRYHGANPCWHRASPQTKEAAD